MASGSQEPDRSSDAVQQKVDIDLLSHFKSLTGKNTIKTHINVEVHFNDT